jgi:hypothetical protein
MNTPRALLLCLLLAFSGAEAVALEAVYISEFVAANQNGLRDEDEDQPDWIEIYNSGPTVVDLTGWSLSDEASKPRKWVFPAKTVEPGSFLIVFASGKDRAITGQPLHTSFKLSAAGGYLGLFKPDRTIAHEYASYGGQYDDKPYGIGQAVQITEILSATSGLKFHVPTSAVPATAEWTARGYNDSISGWSSGTGGVGYETTVPGFAFKTWFANTAVSSLAMARSVINNPSQQTSFFSETRSVVNFLNSGGEAHYVPNSTPAWLAGSDRENYVVEASGRITIPFAGTWTFGVNSDDGFELYIGGSRVCFYDAPRLAR